MNKLLRQEKGFSLVELIVTMVIFVMIIVAASQIFVNLLGQFKQQSKIAETNIEGLIGLELLRNDIEQGGYGLPWDLDGVTYSEAVDDGNTPQNETAYNDAPANAPRAFAMGDNTGFVPGAGADGTANTASDVLVIKASNISTNDAASRWTYILNNGVANTINTWKSVGGSTICDENPRPMSTPPAGCPNTAVDNVIALRPAVGARHQVLVHNGNILFTAFNSSVAAFSSNFQPTELYDNWLIYGISSSDNPRMPFNRADYYIRRPAAGSPSRCEPSTGTLYKAMINHSDGSHSELPLLDCVAAMQVVFAMDTNLDGTVETWGAPPATANASDIRSQLKEVYVFIIAQEGQLDTSFQSPATIAIPGVGGAGVTTFHVPNRNYRWRLYTIIAKPYNLR